MPPRVGRRPTADDPDLTLGAVPGAAADGVSGAAAPEADDEPETGPLRRCVVTRERDYRNRMLRFVVGPDRMVVPDLHAKLPGRGIWLSARRDVLDTARTKGAFARAARGQVTVPPGLTGMVQAGLLRRVTELLGLARRAGQAVSGFEKAREWLVAGKAGLVVQASDGSPDERARFLSGNGARAKATPVVSPLPASALGAVFSRDHVVHVAVRHGRLAEALDVECNRLLGVAGQDGRMGQTVT